MPVLIDEVLRRAARGRTAPYLCRAEDGQLYFVKNRVLARRELAAEWVSSHLARALGLPLPAFCVVEVPAALVDPAMGDWLADLAPGLAFASRYVESTEPTRARMAQVPVAERVRIAAFDWWLRNMQRRAAPGPVGIRNLLWQTDPSGSGRVLLIDHSRAFDPRFDVSGFLATHVYGADLVRLAADFIDRERLRGEFVRALDVAATACATMPAAWRQVDSRDECAFLAQLARCQADDVFWTSAS
ncbi:HipA family kinase [Sphaerotilus sp.]|uniref:HipA family kinase n=1 Tax=Sphaerotilus sp. TaxID=2093942 RepID=UPI0034E1AEF4